MNIQHLTDRSAGRVSLSHRETLEMRDESGHYYSLYDLRLLILLGAAAFLHWFMANTDFEDQYVEQMWVMSQPTKGLVTSSSEDWSLYRMFGIEDNSPTQGYWHIRIRKLWLTFQRTKYKTSQL